MESLFQAKLIKKLRVIFPGCLILKNASSYLQGIPDILILFESTWAMLEVKDSPNAKRQPNQTYYIDALNDMSFAAFIYPENEESVLHELQRAFEHSRISRFSKS